MRDSKSIMETIIGIDREFKTHINKEFEKIGLTASQARILGFITHRQADNICSRDIEKRFDLTHPTVNGILKRLENKEMIFLVNSETDKRIKHIYLTEKANQLHKNIHKLMVNNENRIMSCITDIEKEQLLNLLTKIYYNLKEE